MPKAFYVAAAGSINYQNFLVKVNFPEDMWIAAAEMRPGNAKVVHPYDNSINNEFNPDPTKLVFWGDQNWDDMQGAFLGLVFDQYRRHKGFQTIRAEHAAARKVRPHAHGDPVRNQ